ncbi:MAG: hypothetical protein KIC61_04455 [Staphylococcus sp.]|jgi:hypothetical protein|nr:hypothetical protein [Staphylococcus sp.]
MKNYFIVNPIAGEGKGLEVVQKQIDNLNLYLKADNEFEILLTTKPKEAIILAEKICEENKNTMINIFACGGDGTSFEVLNGIVNFSNVNFGIIPVGSCNDFLKTFENHDFLSLERQLLGQKVGIDVLESDGEFLLNVANFGFDARTNYDQIRYRHRFKTIKKAYNFSLFKNILSPKLGDEVDVYVDGNLIFSGKMMLSTVANAKYYGGGFKCAPHAEYQDGLADILVVKKVSIFTFARLVKFYKKGLHLDNERFNKLLTYRRGQIVDIIAKKALVGCLDGETRISKNFKVKIHKNKIKFIIPA